MTGWAWRLGSVAVLLVGLAASATAQDEQPPNSNSIVSEGTATVEAAPDYIEFLLVRSVTAASAAEAVYNASQLEGQLDAALKASDLPTPSSREVSGVSFTDVNNPHAASSANVVFPARAYADPKTGLADFAALCDNMVAFAEILSCTVEGPRFSVAAKEELEQSAVARAVEQALTPALGAAMVMKTRIESVDSVEVKELVWNKEPEPRAVESQVTRVTCTAKVRVRYLFSAAQ